MWCACGQSECDSGHDSGRRYAKAKGKGQFSLGKGKLRSPVGGTIYANVIWPGMKWKYASGTPCPPFPSLPSRLFFSPPIPPSRSPWALPLNQLGGLGSDVRSLSGSGAKPQPKTDLVHISEPKGAALVATVFVHFHNNKFKFLYKHKTA